MTIVEQALAYCDEHGITDANDREIFVQGYFHGSHDQLMKEIQRDKETLQHLFGALPNKFIPDAETR